MTFGEDINTGMLKVSGEEKTEEKRRQLGREKKEADRKSRNENAAVEELKRDRKSGVAVKGIERREKEERQKRNESRYNNSYINIRTEKLSKYLEGKKKMKGLG